MAPPSKGDDDEDSRGRAAGVVAVDEHPQQGFAHAFGAGLEGEGLLVVGAGGGAAAGELVVAAALLLGLGAQGGEVGVVIQQNQVRRLQPRVLVLLAPDKSVERFPRTLDLLMQPETTAGEPYRIVQALPPNAFGIDPNDFFLA